MKGQLFGYCLAVCCGFALLLVLPKSTFAQEPGVQAPTQDAGVQALARTLVAPQSKRWKDGPQTDAFVDMLVSLIDNSHGWSPKDPLWQVIGIRGRG